MPLAVYNTNLINSNETRKKIILMGKLLQSFINLCNTLMTMPAILTNATMQVIATFAARLTTNIAEISAQYLGYNWLPPQLFRFFDIAILLFSGGITKETAEKAGFNMAVIFGTTSAQALGKVLAFSLIHQLPKLKEESAEENQIENKGASSSYWDKDLRRRSTVQDRQLNTGGETEVTSSVGNLKSNS